jgi:hypothetical protein
VSQREEARRPQLYCPNCGAEVRSGNAFCGSCGAKLPADAHDATSAQLTRVSQSILHRGNGRRPKWVAATIVVLMLLAGGGAVAYAVVGTGTNLLGITNPQLGDDNQANTTTSQTTAPQSGRVSGFFSSAKSS